MNWTQEKINETYVRIQKLATADEDFRNKLLQNPNSVITEIIGEDLPEGFNVKIVESDPAYSATFVLPPMSTGEISSDDLKNVAGGVLYEEINPFCNKGCGADRPSVGVCMKGVKV